MKGESGFEIVTHLALTVIRPSQHLKSIESAACRRRLLINCGGFWTRFSHALSVSRGFESGANSWPVYITSKIGNIFFFFCRPSMKELKYSFAWTRPRSGSVSSAENGDKIVGAARAIRYRIPRHFKRFVTRRLTTFLRTLSTYCLHVHEAPDRINEKQ